MIPTQKDSGEENKQPSPIKHISGSNYSSTSAPCTIYKYV